MTAPKQYAMQVAHKLHAVAEDRRDADLSSFCADVVVDLGIMKQGQGDLSSSVALYSEALRMNESHDSALFQMGTLAVAQGKRDDAKLLYRKAVESKPGHVQVRLSPPFSVPTCSSRETPMTAL